MLGLDALPGTLCTWAWKAASMGWKMESESGSVYYDQVWFFLECNAAHRPVVSYRNRF